MRRRQDPAAEAIKALKALPDDASDAKTQIAKEAVQDLPEGAAEHKREIAEEAVQALPDDASDAKTQIAKEAVQDLPEGAAEHKREIAEEAVQALPDDAAEHKRKIARDAARDLPPEYQDSLPAEYVSTRRLFRRVFVWTIGGALAVAILVTVFAAVGIFFWDQDQILLRVGTPATTLLLGYLIGKYLTEKADINYLQEIHRLRQELNSLRGQQAED